MNVYLTLKCPPHHTFGAAWNNVRSRYFSFLIIQKGVVCEVGLMWTQVGEIRLLGTTGIKYYGQMAQWSVVCYSSSICIKFKTLPLAIILNLDYMRIGLDHSCYTQ